MRLEREQQDDTAADGEQKRAEMPGRPNVVAECEVADQAADQRADDSDGDRREAADRLAAGSRDARDEPGDEPEDEEREDAHGGEPTAACAR